MDRIRWMIRRDLPQVLKIDTEFGTSPEAWEEDDFLEELRKFDTIAMVLERGDKILGFMVYRLHKHHLEVVRMAAEHGPEWAEHIANMVQKLASKLSHARRTYVCFDVGEEEVALQKALSAAGMRGRLVRRWGVADTIEFCREVKAEAPAYA